jgi:hypothetical protein
MPTRRSICRRLIGMQLCVAFAALRQSACDTAAGTGVAGPATGVAGPASGTTRRRCRRRRAPCARRNASDTQTVSPDEARDILGTRQRAVRRHTPFRRARHASPHAVGRCATPRHVHHSLPGYTKCTRRSTVRGAERVCRRHTPGARTCGDRWCPALHRRHRCGRARASPGVPHAALRALAESAQLSCVGERMPWRFMRR